MKYCTALLVLAFAAYVQAGTWVYVDDDVDHMRVRRAAQDEGLGLLRRAGPPPLVPNVYAEDLPVSASNAYKGHGKGRVGPVYTFVKTDPNANFKWGVRHVAGVQYGK